MTSPHSNLLLDSLPAVDRDRLIALTEPVDLPAATILSSPRERPEFAFFMTSGMTSVVAFMSDGRGTEVGIVGREGLVSAFQLLGPANVPSTALVQIAGTALRIPFAALLQEFRSCEPLRTLILQYVLSHTSQLRQLAACNSYHDVVQRLARWLLMVQDRIGGDLVNLTQDYLSQMLGVGRQSINGAAIALQTSGAIVYQRGEVRISDRASLETSACECYGIVRDLHQQLY